LSEGLIFSSSFTILGFYLFEGSGLGGCGVYLFLLSKGVLGYGVAFNFGLRFLYAVQMHHPTVARQKSGDKKTKSNTRTIITSTIIDTKKSSMIGIPQIEVKTRNIATINPESPK
jgi:hypothetical protein